MADDRKFIRILDLCLDQVLLQGASVELCLEAHPEYAEAVEPFLRLAVRTRETLRYTPSDSSKARARATLYTAIQAQKTQGPASRWQRFLQIFSLKAHSSHQWAINATAAALVVMLATSGIVAASSGSDPDQPLYPVKRVVERTRLVFTFDNESKAKLYARFAKRRMAEMAAMAAKGKVNHVGPLGQDVHNNLRQIKNVVLPGVPLALTYVTPWPSETNPSNSDGAGRLTEIEALKLGTQNRINVPTRNDQGNPRRQLANERAQANPRFTNRLPPGGLRAIHRMLESQVTFMDATLRPVISEAPEDERAELRRTMAETEKDYRELILTFQQIAASEEREARDEKAGQ